MFEIPAGWMGDVFGPRKTLIRIVIGWSLCVGLIACAGLLFNYYILLFIFLLFGIAEAGAFPNISKSLFNWFPAHERGFTQGSVWLSARFMGGLTPFIWILFTDPELLGLNWRTTLFIFAGLAGFWCVIFSYFFYNTPREHKKVNELELKEIEHQKSNTSSDHHDVPWKKIFLSRNVQLLATMYFFMNYGWYYLLFFLPGFMKSKFQTDTDDVIHRMLIGFLSGTPLLLGMGGCLLGGWLSDREVRKTHSRKWARRKFALIGFGLCIFFYLLSIQALYLHHMLFFAICVAAVGFCNDLTMGSAWASCQDIGQNHAAIVAGVMNMIGNLGGAVSTTVTGMLLDKNSVTDVSGDSKNVVICLLLYVVAYFFGMGCWLLINADNAIESKDGKSLELKQES